MGDRIADGTATSGSTSSLVDTAILNFETNNDIEDFWVAVIAGVAIGDERNIASYTASSSSLAPRGNFSGTIDTSSKYLVTKQWRAQQYLDAIAGAQRRAQFKMVLPLDDVDGNLHELITFGDILSTDGNGNGQMEQWSNGAALAPDGWTLDSTGGAVARDSDTDDVRRGKYSARLTSDGTQTASLSQSIKHFQRYAGRTLTFKCWVKASVTARARVRISDGVSTDVSATESVGVNKWELLEAELTLDSNLTGLDVFLEITAGSAVVVSFDHCRLLSPVTIYSYDLPTRLAYLAEVSPALTSDGSQQEDAYINPIERRLWHVEGGANPRLIFTGYRPPLDRSALLRGQVWPNTITNGTPATAYTESVEVNPEYIKAYAKWYLWGSIGPNAHDQDSRLAMRDNQQTFLDMEASMSIRPYSGSERVQVA